MRPPAFAVVAHNDDWQMFMARDLFAHIAAPDERVVIVQLTAGDAGRAAWYGKARRQGAVASVVRATRGWAPSDLPSLTAARADAVHDIAIEDAAYFAAPPLPATYSVGYDAATILDRALLRCTVTGSAGAPTAVYFLDLPDGGVDGAGFPATGHTSLARFAEGACAGGMHALWAPDGGAPAHYRDRQALVDVLAAIVRAELGAADPAAAWVHTTADDAATDHADHAVTNRLVAAVNRSGFADRLRIASAYGYATREMPAARNDEQRAVLAAYAGGFMAAAGGAYGWPAVWAKEFAWWGDREYWETPAGPSGTSPCRHAPG